MGRVVVCVVEDNGCNGWNWRSRGHLRRGLEALERDIERVDEVNGCIANCTAGGGEERKYRRLFRRRRIHGLRDERINSDIHTREKINTRRHYIQLSSQ